MKNPRVIVTGGAGFIGSHLTDKLVNMEYEVCVIDNLSLGKKENINKKAEFWETDIRDLDMMKWLFEDADYVFHCAAMPRIQPSIKNPDESFTNNLLGTNNVLVAAKDAGVKKVIYSGSSSVYGDQPVPYMALSEEMIPNPKNPYALDKLQSEQRCLKFFEWYSLPVVCLRYFNVFGERQSMEGAYATVVGIFLQQKARGEKLTVVGDGLQRRDFTYVSDVVSANILAMLSDKAVGQIINIGTGKNYSIQEIVDLIQHPHIILPPRPGEARKTLADISKAQRLLDFKPTMSLELWLSFQFNEPMV